MWHILLSALPKSNKIYFMEVKEINNLTAF